MLCIVFFKRKIIYEKYRYNKRFLINSKVNFEVFLCKIRVSGLFFRKIVFKILVFVFNEIVLFYVFKKFIV